MGTNDAIYYSQGEGIEYSQCDALTALSLRGERLAAERGIDEVTSPASEEADYRTHLPKETTKLGA